MIRLNKNDLQNMIANRDTFKVKLSLEIEDMINEEFRTMDDIIISHNNLRMKYNISDINDMNYNYFDNYLIQHDILDVINNSYNIVLIEYKKCDIDDKQKELYLQIQDMETLMSEYEKLSNDCTLSLMLKNDIGMRIQNIYIELSELMEELNDYYVNNFDGTKHYDEYNNRYDELKKILD